MYDVKFFTKVTVIDFSKYQDDSSTRKLYTEKNYHYAAKRYLKYIYAMRGEEVTYSNMVRCSFTMMSDIMPHVYTDDAIEALLSLSEDDERFVEGLSYRKAAALKKYLLRDLLILRILINTGMKSSELTSLRIGDIVKEPNELVYSIRTLKENRGAYAHQVDKNIVRTIKQKYIKDLLDRHIATLSDPLPHTLLFQSRYGGKLSDKYLSKLIGDLCEVADVDYINIKAFRHTYARKKIVVDKVKPETLKELLGYRLMRSVKHYYLVYEPSEV